MDEFSSYLKHLVQSCMLDRQNMHGDRQWASAGSRTVQLRPGLSLQVMNCATKQMHGDAIAYQKE